MFGVVDTLSHGGAPAAYTVMEPSGRAGGPVKKETNRRKGHIEDGRASRHEVLDLIRHDVFNLPPPDLGFQTRHEMKLARTKSAAPSARRCTLATFSRAMERPTLTPFYNMLDPQEVQFRLRQWVDLVLAGLTRATLVFAATTQLGVRTSKIPERTRQLVEQKYLRTYAPQTTYENQS